MMMMMIQNARLQARYKTRRASRLFQRTVYDTSTIVTFPTLLVADSDGSDAADTRIYLHKLFFYISERI